MSKKITHEQIKEIFYKIYYHIENIPRKELIDRYFLQQEKQEKLLELYKRLNNFYEELYTMELSKLSLNSGYYEIEIFKVKHQIKELENENI